MYLFVGLSNGSLLCWCFLLVLLVLALLAILMALMSVDHHEGHFQEEFNVSSSKGLSSQKFSKQQYGQYRLICFKYKVGSNDLRKLLMIILSHSTEVILKIHSCIYKSHNNDEAKFSEGDN